MMAWLLNLGFAASGASTPAGSGPVEISSLVAELVETDTLDSELVEISVSNTEV